MLTYSFGQPPVDALKLQNLSAVLNLLPDNTQKLIAPKDVRDSLYTVWENIAFKPTKVSTSDIEYIGIDQPLLKSKIYFGKRTNGGKEIMNNELLSELEYDYYFFGTRSEPTTEHNTRIGFLAGTGSLYQDDGLGSVLSIPYVEAKVVQHFDLQKYINFNIVNKSYVFDGVDRVGGDINIYSDTGKISLNGIVLPRLLDNIQSANNDKYLKFIWDEQNQLGVATWSTIGEANISEVTSTGTVSITGSPILINGENILFSDSNEVPATIGGILEGSTFQNQPVTEVLRQLLYPYLAPSITKNEFKYNFIESGNSTTGLDQTLSYELKVPGTYSIINFSMSPSATRTGSSLILPGNIPQGTTSSGVKPNFIIDLPPTSASLVKNYTLTLYDGVTTKTSQSSFQVVLPWFYGTSKNLSTVVTDINSMLGSLTKILRGSAGINELVNVQLSTNTLSNNQGCVYFAYPSQYKDLEQIFDQTGQPIISGYRKYTINGIASPNSYWGSGPGRQYKVYVYAPLGTPAYTTIPPLSQYTFKFDASIVGGP